MKPLFSFVGKTLTAEVRAEMESYFGPVHVAGTGQGIASDMKGVILRVNAAGVILDTAVV